jgi:enoyl-CoA hydratase/carnithine racemase
MEPVSTKQIDGVLVATMQASPTNPIDLLMVKALTKAIDETYKTESRAFVLTSASEKFFSIGFDLPHLLDLGWEGFWEFYTAFNKMCLKLYTLHVPTISAIPGHCVAGGCVLATMTDYRFWAEGKGKGGVNELRLGVPMPLLPTMVLAQLLGERKATEMIYSGSIYDQAWLSQAGFIDRLVAPQKLLEESAGFVREIGKIPSHAFEASKAMRTGDIEKAYLKKQEEESTRFLECWFKDETRALLNEAKKKF